VYACLCRAVTETSVRAVVKAGASTVAEVRATCGAGTGCGGCLPSLRRLLAECRGPGLACTSAATLDPAAGLMDSTCSGICAQSVGPSGEPLCVAGLRETAVDGHTSEGVGSVAGVAGTTLSFA
jgi:bacterioferritin-associated ferredoxin